MRAPIEYSNLFNSCVLTTDPLKVTELKIACRNALTNQLIYARVQAVTHVPWLVIACIHFRESSQNFNLHLHNGDPLSERTVHVPAGRPASGEPPFAWQDSAIDALTGFWRPFKWDVAGMLEFCERYNGLGYMTHGVNSPYLWSCTDKYVSGLFIADGKLDMTRKDGRPGVASLLKCLSEREKVSLDFEEPMESIRVVH